MTTQKLIKIVFLLAIALQLQARSPKDQVTVDRQGVMRWSKDKSELKGFGVNYTLPFAHEYRMANRAGVSHEEAIRQDVYHMARLDLDLYRVHVWDTEISDTVGNLIDNEHLRLFDFAINEMKQRGMRFIITPIAYWGNGWPEPDEQTPGFSHKYGKAGCLTHPAAIAAQAVYLEQFLNHVNRYTGIAYKDDPSVIAFEISNEPHHDEPAEKVTAFINRMVASMRKTGSTKPIFYNMSHSIHLADAYLKANVQGGTFQWYPTNLVANRQIKGNFLPHVQSYRIPFAEDARFKKMAKIVYEFDPADAGGNILYPAMARTYREAGMQLATHFAYDALCWAPYNTNYGTHFMNLAYAPQKAISLKIASAVFHHVPMYEKHSDHSHFGDFHISYPRDLAEWVTEEKFFYSNTTQSQPARTDKLTEVAGVGSSPLVKYSGSGAYFLDKLSDGIWRLELMPDAFWVEDPYSPVDPNKQKAAVIHTPQQMNISLSDLGNEFRIQPINKGNHLEQQMISGPFTVTPGVYLLSRKDVKAAIVPTLRYKNIRIDEFVAPASNLNNTVLHNHSPEEIVAGKPLQLQFEAVSPSPILKIQVVLSMNEKWKTVEAVANGSSSYMAEIPNEILTPGFLHYRVIVEDNKESTKFPGAVKGDPWSWEYRDDRTYTVRVVPSNTPLALWEASSDWESSYKIWNPSVHLEPTQEGTTALSIKLAKLPAVDTLSSHRRSYAFKYYFGDKIKGRRDELTQKKDLLIKATNLLPLGQVAEIGLTDQNGSVLAEVITLSPQKKEYSIPLDSFTKADFVIIPRPYPDFLPYQVTTNSKLFDWPSIETLQLMLIPGQQEKVDVKIERVWME